MQYQSMYSDRMNGIPESFIREILKVATQKNTISFAGGLPNPQFFPVEKLAEAAEKVISSDGKSIFQYSVTEGFMPLRELLASWETKKSGATVSPEQILITNGSQQGLDLAGKVFLNEGETVLMEAPTYLGAIQAFSAYAPVFNSVPLESDGIDINQLETYLDRHSPKLFYLIPDFQNPGGASYSEEKRKQIADIFRHRDTVLIEDSAYREIGFKGQSAVSVRSLLPGNTVQLNSFSKIVSPGLRLGWMVAPAEMIKKFTVAKQASDLHSSIFTQRVLLQFLMDNDLEQHLNRIRSFYGSQCDRMDELFRKYIPENVSWTKPGGGMFFWMKLPEGMDAQLILKEAMKENLVFVPGNSFYLNPEEGSRYMRINFSATTGEEMERGVQILGNIIAKLLC